MSDDRDRINLIAHWLVAADREMTEYESEYLAAKIVSGSLMTEANRRELALAIAPEIAAELPGIPY